VVDDDATRRLREARDAAARPALDRYLDGHPEIRTAIAEQTSDLGDALAQHASDLDEALMAYRDADAAWWDAHYARRDAIRRAQLAYEEQVTPAKDAYDDACRRRTAAWQAYQQLVTDIEIDEGIGS